MIHSQLHNVPVLSDDGVMEAESRCALFFLPACSWVYAFLVRQVFCYGKGVGLNPNDSKGLAIWFSFIVRVLLLWHDSKCMGSSVFDQNSELWCVTSKAWGESEEIPYTCVLGGTCPTKGGYVHLSWLLGLPASWVVREVKWLLSPVSESMWDCGRQRGLQRSAEICRGSQVS